MRTARNLQCPEGALYTEEEEDYLASSGELNSRRCKVNISMPGKKFPCTK